MELINKQVRFDQHTFTPVVQITLELSVEACRDMNVLFPVEEVKKKLGSELYDLLEFGKMK